MKLAVIDCGTNTFNLIIVRVKERNSYEKIFHSRIPVKLGERTINGGFIDERPFRRGIDAVSNFYKKIKEEKVDKVLAFATSAIRDASNGPEFVKQVSERFNIGISVIDGNEEAELVYIAVSEAVELSDEVSLIMDIGGGSTEFILANRERIFWKCSFTIGAARLLALFNPGERINAREIKNIKDHLEKELHPLFDAVREYPPTELVGSSGAFESFVEMIHGEFGGEPLTEDRTSFEIDLAHYRGICNKVLASDLEERQNMKGLIPMRVDMIVICCLMVDFVLEKFRLQKMRMSVWSLKEGAMVDFVKKYN